MVIKKKYKYCLLAVAIYEWTVFQVVVCKLSVWNCLYPHRSRVGDGWMGLQASAEISLIHKVTKGSVTLNKVNTGLIM